MWGGGGGGGGGEEFVNLIMTSSRIISLTSSTYVAGRVRGPRDAIDRGTMVAQSGHWYAGHSDIKDYHLVIKITILIYETSAGSQDLIRSMCRKPELNKEME